MKNYKILIASAGTGSRLKAHTSFRNKALISLGAKPAISHIIDKFPGDVPIVVAVGYEAQSLIEIVTELHPDRDIEFVHVDQFEGPGSGLGRSMLACERALQCPFVFIPNDTLGNLEDFEFNPHYFGNWIGLYDNGTASIDPSHYRCAEVVDGEVVSILPKGLNTKNIYIGLCGIRDYKKFWKSMNSSLDAIPEGESFGLNALQQKKAIFLKQWLDTGNLNRLEEAQSEFKDPRFNILPKKEEAIWISGDKCVKYHKDVDFIAERVKRLSFLPADLVPKMHNIGVNYFSYEFVEGQMLASLKDVSVYECFLHTMQESLWSVQSEQYSDSVNIQEGFYRKKTHDRIRLYLSRFDQDDAVKFVNGRYVGSVFDTLSQVDWDNFYSGAIWAHFHGDLHGENVVVQKNNKFKLLDWRQNFGSNNFEYGDVYYDLAKILHGLIVRHDIVGKDAFAIRQDVADAVDIDIDNSMFFFDLQNLFKEFCLESGYDYQRVRLVTALIFLNIAALHHYPYAKFLFLLGKLHLSRALNA